MHFDGISFDKILSNQVGYFGTLTEKENSATTLAAPRRGFTCSCFIRF
jgi:hypothetical protein